MDLVVFLLPLLPAYYFFQAVKMNVFDVVIRKHRIEPGHFVILFPAKNFQRHFE